MINTEKPFWRPDSPFTPQETELFNRVLHSHHFSAFRQNVSTEMLLKTTVAGRADLPRAIAAGLLTLGGLHAPLEQTYFVLKHPSMVKPMLTQGEKVPGWGNSFQKDGPDPLWQSVDTCIRQNWPEEAAKLDQVTQLLHERGKKIFPNPSAYTALSGLILQMPPELLPYLFISGRIGAWAEVFANFKDAK